MSETKKFQGSNFSETKAYAFKFVDELSKRGDFFIKSEVEGDCITITYEKPKQENE